MKPKRKPKNPKGLVIWTKPKSRSLNIQSQFSRNNLFDFLKKHEDEWVRITFAPMSKPKSQKILGFWWGAILPAFVCHNKNIKWSDDPFFLNELLKEKKITNDEISEAHDILMSEFRPIMIFDLRTGKPTKQRGRMEKMNNTEVMSLITDVLDYYSENGYPIPDAEEYKKILNLSNLIKEHGLQALDGKSDSAVYPDYDSSQCAF